MLCGQSLGRPWTCRGEALDESGKHDGTYFADELIGVDCRDLQGKRSTARIAMFGWDDEIDEQWPEGYEFDIRGVSKAEGASKGRKAARRAALLGGIGAGIGALADGGKGAAIGATAGAGLGAISGAAAKGKHLKVPAETRLNFVLRAPLPLG